MAADEVLTNMVQAGFMTEGQVHGARLNPAKPIQTGLANSPDWFLDWAYEEVQRLAEGKNQYVLTARTTVDLTMQRQADEALVSCFPRCPAPDSDPSGGGTRLAPAQDPSRCRRRPCAISARPILASLGDVERDC